MAIRTPNNTATIVVGYIDHQFPDQSLLNSNKRLWLERAAQFFEGLSGGTRQGVVTTTSNGGTSAAYASGTVTIASGSGSITATINGVGISVTWATSDTATAAALAAAINASVNALVQPFVSATSALGVVTITAKNLGVQGNTVTLAASGTGATASGARLTGGVDGTSNTVTV